MTPSSANTSLVPAGTAATNFDVLVLGAGAAGLMCAIEAGNRGRRVAVLERAERIGKKILISGGGRCNFTNIHCTPQNFISANPHFAKSALARYTPADFIALVEKHGIHYHEKTLGQLFCDNSASEITNMLEAECKAASVPIFLDCKIREVLRTTEFADRSEQFAEGGEKSVQRNDEFHERKGQLEEPSEPFDERAEKFVVRTSQGEFRASALVVATGGLSIPKMGASSFGYDLARQFGLQIIEPRPALVPFLLSSRDRSNYCDLAGVSAEAIVTLKNNHASTRTEEKAHHAHADVPAFREKMLITHRGLSGPAILQISSYWAKGISIQLDLAPEREVTASIREAKTRNATAARSAFLGILPKRLAERWLDLHEPKSWSNDALAQLEEQVHAWTLTPSGTEGYEKAEVTAGGVDTDELSSKTMQSRKVSGLYFIGEVVDVTGHLGGFNFQWAWASGAAAGRAV
jgi:predicted flavoprotein YhiN